MKFETTIRKDPIPQTGHPKMVLPFDFGGLGSASGPWGLLLLMI